MSTNPYLVAIERDAESVAWKIHARAYLYRSNNPRNGNSKVDAIKAFREVNTDKVTGERPGLKEAKDVVELYVERLLRNETFSGTYDYSTPIHTASPERTVTFKDSPLKLIIRTDESGLSSIHVVRENVLASSVTPDMLPQVISELSINITTGIIY